MEMKNGYLIFFYTKYSFLFLEYIIIIYNVIINQFIIKNILYKMDKTIQEQIKEINKLDLSLEEKIKKYRHYM